MKFYTQPGCSKCMLLKRTLDNHKIKYEVIDDSNEVMSIAKEVGSMELPIINMDGNYYSGIEAIKEVQGRL